MLKDDELSKIYSGKNILITGVTGFKGSWLALWLSLLGAKVYGISLNGHPSVIIKRYVDSGKIKLFKADITNVGHTQSILREVKPSFVFHFAAQSIFQIGITNPLSTYMTNFYGTLSLLEALRTLSGKTVAVFNSSGIGQAGQATNDRNGSPYAVSKAISEKLVKSYQKTFFENLETASVIVKIGNVIGGGDFNKIRLVPSLVNALQLNEDFKIDSPHKKIKWIHVMDAINAYLFIAAMRYQSADNLMEIPSIMPGLKSYSVSDLVTDMTRFIKYPATNDFIVKPAQPFFNETLTMHPKIGFHHALKITAEWYLDYQNNPQQAVNITEKQIIDYLNM